MTKPDLDRAFALTPEAFSRRVEQTLQKLEEEIPARRYTFRKILFAALFALLLFSAAYALTVQGQRWYYQNRFAALQTHKPEKYEAIMDTLSEDIPQQETANPLATLTVQDASWSMEQGVATLGFAFRAADPSGYELHTIDDLDVDGECHPSDSGIGSMRYLWTENGFGPPRDVMYDPEKQLILIDFGRPDVFIGTQGEAALPVYSYDYYDGEDGAQMLLIEFNLSHLDADAIAGELAENLETQINRGYTLPEDYLEKNARLQEHRMDIADAANAAIAASTDGNGMLTLRYHYRVVPFRDGMLLDGEAVDGSILFQIKIR